MFKRPPMKPAKQMDDYTPRPRAVAVPRSDVAARMNVAVPKEAVLRDEGYLRLVATLPCIWCEISGYTQVAHANEGKGQAIKAGDDTAMPLCGPRPMVPGCHATLDQAGILTREQRRLLERQWGEKTRKTLRLLAQFDPHARRIVERSIGL